MYNIYRNLYLHGKTLKKKRVDSNRAGLYNIINEKGPRLGVKSKTD